MKTTRRSTIASLVAVAVGGLLPATAWAGNHSDKRTAGVEQGAVAPDFTLRMLNSDETVQLSKRIGERPVVLVFGSYT